MKIFITGIKGFIPSHLANKLSFGHGVSVFGIDNDLHPSKRLFFPGIRIFYGDVRYPSDIDQYVKEADLVYHMAAQINVDKSIQFPSETLDINLMGTLNVLEACRRYNKPMVFASTSEVYGSHTEVIDESSPTYAQSPYAVSKLAADKLCGNYHDLYGLEVYRVRCFNTFGPYQSTDQYGAVIPKFVDAVLHGKSPIIFGNGKQERDYIHVDDVVEAYRYIPKIKELAGTPVNLGTGKSVQIRKIAELIIKNINPAIKPVFIEARKGEVYKLKANTNLLKKYGFKSKVSFESGLKDYIEWAKKLK